MKNPFAGKTLKERLILGIPFLVIAIAMFWVASRFIEPAPPRTLYMSTGTSGGAYQAYAEKYKEILARQGITLELQTSTGSLQNLERLADEDNPVTIAFVQGGIDTPVGGEYNMTLGSMYYEPLWVFYRSEETYEQLTQLRGKRLAIGTVGSGNHKLVMQILTANDMQGDSGNHLALGGNDAAEALLEGKVDAALIIAGADSTVVRKLLNADHVRLMNFAQADAYVSMFPFLYKVTLPRGGASLPHNLPGRDITLVATTANLIARDSTHPALVSLIAGAAQEVHGKSGMFQRAGEFPAIKDKTFQVNTDAERYYKSGPPFLERYLPFWIAVLVDRIWVMIIPLLALIPILRLLPSLYRWRVTSRINRWYGVLSALELEIRHQYDPSRQAEYMAKIDDIEERANSYPIPVAYAHLGYTLREHINLVRAALERKSGQAKIT
jgi:TRAP transporter TAXI family solute receptor